MALQIKAYIALLAGMLAWIPGTLAEGVTEPGRVTVPGGEVRYVIQSNELELPREAVHAWIERSAQTVAGYYGRFPVADVEVVVIPVSGGGVRTGKAFPAPTPIINVYVGRATRQIDLARDWIMVHEMVHLAFPSMPPAQKWISEGIATYVGTVAPANMGDASAESVWSEFVQGMPNGLPAAGDKGLDHTPTWGRRYWGGALFCLLADIEIRKRTEDRYSLRDALRGIVVSGATMAGPSGQLANLFRVADEAVGVPVLFGLYQEMRATPVHTDLDTLWRKLGVTRTGDSVQFENSAPLAAIRRQITGVAPKTYYSDAHSNELRIP